MGWRTGRTLWRRAGRFWTRARTIRPRIFWWVFRWPLRFHWCLFVLSLLLLVIQRLFWWWALRPSWTRWTTWRFWTTFLGLVLPNAPLLLVRPGLLTLCDVGFLSDRFFCPGFGLSGPNEGFK